MQDRVKCRGDKLKQAFAEKGAREEQRVAGRQKRKHDIGFHGQKTRKKRQPAVQEIAPFARLSVAKKEIEGKQKEEAAGRENVLARPGHHYDQLTAGDPEHGGEEARQA